MKLTCWKFDLFGDIQVKIRLKNIWWSAGLDIFSDCAMLCVEFKAAEADNEPSDMNRYLHLPVLNEHKSVFCGSGGKRLECFLREFSVMKAYWMRKWIKQRLFSQDLEWLNDKIQMAEEAFGTHLSNISRARAPLYWILARVNCR